MDMLWVFLDGRIAAEWIRRGRVVNHGDLLSSVDAYAIGYREGLNVGWED
jgi:hypothetical protein